MLVTCKMATGSTCIQPRPNLIHVNELRDEGLGHTWFSDMSDGYIVSIGKMTLKIDNENYDDNNKNNKIIIIIIIKANIMVCKSLFLGV